MAFEQNMDAVHRLKIISWMFLFQDLTGFHLQAISLNN
jgi:hypothetical protein